VNGVNVENVEHEFVIRLLKEAKDFIHLVVKRKTANISNMNGSQTPQHLQPLQQIQQPQEQPSTIEQKRHNLAIQQTAATVMANYANTYQNGHAVKAQTANSTTNGTTNGGANLMSTMMNSSHSISSLKPIKLTFNRKDKKELYGIIVGCKYYIKEILPNSLAANEANLKLGDVLLKLNDFDVEQISLIEANRILTKSKENKLHLVVKRNSMSSLEDEELFNELPTNQIKPDKVEISEQQQQQQQQQQPVNGQQNHQTNGFNYLNGNGLQQHDVVESGKATESPALSAKIPPPLPPTLPPQPPQPLNHQQPQQHSTPQSSCSVIKQLFKQTKPVSNETSRLSKFYSNKNLVIDYRTVVFARENGIGIRLAGGNKVGIFICDVQYNSPAERAGLRIADKIVKVNGVDYLTLTREEAVQHILSIQNLIEMVVGHSPEEYEANAFDPHGGDSFYVRAHFNYRSKDSSDLSFKINDILHVTDTLYNGVIGQWVASKLNTTLNDEPFEDVRGTVPNLENSEKLATSARTIDQVVAETQEDAMRDSNGFAHSNGFASLGASARMSIRKRLAGGKNTLAKRSRSASRINGLEVESKKLI
jgi:C-terminal processing protease CtpA/Prc